MDDHKTVVMHGAAEMGAWLFCDWWREQEENQDTSPVDLAAWIREEPGAADKLRQLAGLAMGRGEVNALAGTWLAEHAAELLERIAATVESWGDSWRWNKPRAATT